MSPDQIRIAQFTAYPPLAKEIAAKHIDLLRRLPLGYLPLLLRELIAFDWKFPVERREIQRDLHFLSALSPETFAREMSAFAGLKLTADLQAFDWVNEPNAFSEKLTAHLWASHQIDQFRTSAVQYMDHRNQATPESTLPTHRLGLIAIGQGVRETKYTLFRKLRPLGTHFSNVNTTRGAARMLEVAVARASANPEPFAHWYIDGGTPLPNVPEGLARVSYDGLTPVRAQLQRQLRKAYESGTGSEAIRSNLARARPEDFGVTSGDPVLNHFTVSLLTEGSGTQLFATTFAQWAAREALRRAQPLTLFLRFAPRQKERPTDELLKETQQPPELDPHGSLIDADMGAYYTWLNMRRLVGSPQSRFLVWFEDHSQAVALGPGFAAAKASADAVTLESLVAKLL